MNGLGLKDEYLQLSNSPLNMKIDNFSLLSWTTRTSPTFYDDLEVILPLSIDANRKIDINLLPRLI